MPGTMRSFQYYQRGNSLRQGVVKYNSIAVANDVDRQIQHCNASLFAGASGADCAAADTIFIPGLPRAGSTLLEQILASHSMVEGTTELPEIMAVAARHNGRLGEGEDDRYPASLAQQPHNELGKLGQRCIAAPKVHRAEGTPHFIDKMPNNFHHIGLIHLILPNSRIIDAR